MLSVGPELLQSTYISDGVKGNKSRLREWSAHHLSVWLLVIKKWTQSWFRCENIAGKQNNFILCGDLIATQSEVPSSMIRDFPPRLKRAQPFLGDPERSFPLSALSLLGRQKDKKKPKTSSLVISQIKYNPRVVQIRPRNQGMFTRSGLLLSRTGERQSNASIHPSIHPSSPVLVTQRGAGDARGWVAPCGSLGLTLRG